MTLPRSFDAPLDEAPPHKFAVHRKFAEGRRRTAGSRVIAVSAAEACQAIALNFGTIAMIDDAIGQILDALVAANPRADRSRLPAHRLPAHRRTSR